METCIDYSKHVLNSCNHCGISGLSHVVNECDNDLEKYCSNVAPSGGRLMECMDKNMDKISERCKRAMKDVGLK